MRDERDELVLEPVELPQLVVLLGEQPLDRLGLGARGALALEEAPALLGELAQPPVPRFELPGQAPHDREQRDVEN